MTTSVERNLSMYYLGVVIGDIQLEFWNRAFIDVDCSSSSIEIELPPLPSSTTTNTSGSIMIRRIDSSVNTLTIRWEVNGSSRSKVISDTTGTYWFMAVNDPYAEDPLLITRLSETGGGGGGSGGGVLTTTIIQAASASDTFFLVANTDGFPDTGYLRVGNETVRYDLKQTSPPNPSIAFALLQRGHFNTTPASYPVGEVVSLCPGLAFSDFPADRVVITDALSGQLVTSGISGTQLSYLDINSSLTGLLNDRLSRITGGTMGGLINFAGTQALLPIRNGNTTLAYTDNGALLDSSVGSFTVTLPDLVTGVSPNFQPQPSVYYFIKTDSSSNAITLQPSGTDTINNGSTTFDLTTQDEWCIAIGDPNNTDWKLIRSVGGGTSTPSSVVVNGVATTSSGVPTVDGIYAFNISGSGSASSVSAGDIARLSSGTWTVVYASTQNRVIVVYNAGNNSVFTKNGDGWTESYDTDELTAMIRNIAFNIPTLPPAIFATTANVGLTGLTAVDGYTPVAGDVCLVKNQTNSHDNGFYFAAAGAWTRAKFNSATNNWDSLTGSDTTYDDLHIDGGVVYVNNGTVNKNVQFQCAIANKFHTLGSNTVTVQFTSRRISSNRDVFNGYVSVNTGSDSQGNGTQGFPFATISADLTGASFPHTTNLAVSGTAMSESVSLTSGRSNIIFQTSDHSAVGGKLVISGTQTHATGNTRVTWKGMTLNGGSSAPLVYSSGNLFRHNLENITLQTTGTSIMTLPANATNWLNIRNIDLNITTATLPLPVFTNAFTINVYDQNIRLPISGVGASNTTINIYGGSEAVRVFHTYAGTINWTGKSFDYPVNGMITSQSQLLALRTYIADTSQDGFWLLSGFTYTPITCTGASGTGTIATLTFAAQPSAPYLVGDTIVVSGFTPSTYNGSYTVTACSTTSVSYANTTSVSSSVNGDVIFKSFSGGDIIGKQTAAGIATETWYARTYDQAPATVKTLGGLIFYRGPNRTWSLPSSNPTTTLSAAINSSVTTIPVTSTTGFPDSGVILVGNELIFYTSKTTTSFTGATRGFSGTTATSHSLGATVALNAGADSQESMSWDFSGNGWQTASVTITNGLPSSTFSVGGGSFNMTLSVNPDGYYSGTVTSIGNVLSGSCIVGNQKVVPDGLKTANRNPAIKATMKTNTSNFSLNGIPSDSLGFGLLCYSSTGSFIGFVSGTRTAFSLSRSSNFVDSSLDMIQFPSNTYTAAPIIFCSNSITGACSFDVKLVTISKLLISSTPTITNQQIDQITTFGYNGLLIRSNGIAYSMSGSGGVWGSYPGRGNDLVNYPRFYGIENIGPVSLPSTEMSPVIDCGRGWGVSYVLCANGNLYTWGENSNGSCGVGNTSVVAVPTLATTNVTKVFWNNSLSNYAPEKTRLIIQKSDGFIYGAGHNIFGALGLGNTTNQTSFVQLSWAGQNPLSVWPVGTEVGLTFVQRADRTIWVAGYNLHGPAGTGSTATTISTPVNVTTAWNGGNNNMIIKDIVAGMGQYDGGPYPNSTVLMLLDDGTSTLLRACGSATWSQLGDGTTVQKNSPITPNVGSGRVKQIGWSGSGVGSVFALKEDGNLYGWGYNGFGSIGDGTSTPRAAPVLTASGVIEILMPWHVCAVKGQFDQTYIRTSDGYYSCGYNAEGYCGAGFISSSVTTWTKMKFPANTIIKTMGRHFTNEGGATIFAVDTSNNLYGWGYNVHNGVSSGGAAYAEIPLLFKFGTPQFSNSNIKLSSQVPVGDETIIVASSRLQGTTGTAFDFLQTISNNTTYWSGTQYRSPRRQKVTVSGVFQRVAGDCNVWLWKNNARFMALCGLFDVYNRAFSLAVDLLEGDVIDLRPDNAILINGSTSAPYGSVLCITPNYQNQLIQTDSTHFIQLSNTVDFTQTDGGTLIYNTATITGGFTYNSSTGVVTIPANGIYTFGGYHSYKSAGYGGIGVNVNNTGMVSIATNENPTNWVGMAINYQLSLKAGDTLRFIGIRGSYAVLGGSSGARVTITRIGNT